MGTKLSSGEELVRLAIIGQAEEAGITERMNRHLDDLRRKYQGVKDVGELEQAAFVMAFTLFTIEVQQDE